MTGSVFLGLELHLLVVLREFGRLLPQRVLNSREGDGPLLPHDLW